MGRRTQYHAPRTLGWMRSSVARLPKAFPAYTEGNRVDASRHLTSSVTKEVIPMNEDDDPPQSDALKSLFMSYRSGSALMSDVHLALQKDALASTQMRLERPTVDVLTSSGHKRSSVYHCRGTCLVLSDLWNRRAGTMPKRARRAGSRSSRQSSARYEKPASRAAAEEA